MAWLFVNPKLLANSKLSTILPKLSQVYPPSCEMEYPSFLLYLIFWSGLSNLPIALKDEIISWLYNSYKSIFEHTWSGNFDISMGSLQENPLSFDILHPTLFPKLPPNNQLLFQNYSIELA